MAHPFQKEPDNPAENILMASQKADGGGSYSWSAWAWIGLAARSYVRLPADHFKHPSGSTHERRAAALFLLLPLRI
ncbi:MAG: hypothetical protein KF848_09275 [Nitrospira sp.]|nr:hypothetical protein [Nitrospira sp.]